MALLARYASTGVSARCCPVRRHPRGSAQPSESASPLGLALERLRRPPCPHHLCRRRRRRRRSQAKWSPAIVHRYQLWRLVTPVFLHSGVIHIAMNMYTQVRARSARALRADSRRRAKDSRRKAKGVRIRTYATHCVLSRTWFAPIQRHHASHRSGRGAGYPQASPGAGKRPGKTSDPWGARGGRCCWGCRASSSGAGRRFSPSTSRGGRPAPPPAPAPASRLARRGRARGPRRGAPHPAQTTRIRGLDRACAGLLA